MAEPIRILLVEDNDVYRSSLELLLGLQEGMRVVGSVSEGGAAAAACVETQADVVLMDFRLPGMDGAAATVAVRSACPAVAVVCLTAEATDADRAAVLAAGAVGLVEKGRPIEELVAAIRQAAGWS
jgi:DNA-binding NarL/FixJ family response regulator